MAEPGNEKAARLETLKAKILQAIDDEVTSMARLLEEKEPEDHFGDTEFDLREMALRMAAKALQTSLTQHKIGYTGASITCPKCQCAMPFHGYRPLSPLSLVGQIGFKRAYYYCSSCRFGLFPFDALAGINEHRLTPAAEQVVCLAGLSCDGFGEAASEVLPPTSGLRLSESTVQRATEDAGQRCGVWLDRGGIVGENRSFNWHKDAKGRTCAYVSIDATGVPQQAADGGKAEGRMPYLAMVYNPLPDKDVRQYQRGQPTQPTVDGQAAQGPSMTTQKATKKGRRGKKARQPGKPREMEARYVAGLYSLAEVGKLLRQQAAQVGMEQAEQWIAICDGGNGLADFLRSNFNRPNLVVILDYYHAAGYLEKLANAWHGANSAAAQQQSEHWRKQLKNEGGEAVLAAIKAMDLPDKVQKTEAYAELRSYYENHKEKMTYPHYLEQGWQIGSGPVESGCNAVICQRMKLAGMRWREPGTDNVCHLRALLKCEPTMWRAFWAARPKSR